MPESITLTFTALTGPLAGKSLTFEQTEVTLGRQSDNDIQLVQDQRVSRHHCRIYKLNAAVWLEDLNSSNGTLLTRPGLAPQALEPNHPAILLENSVIQVGDSRLSISGIADEQDPALGTIGAQFQEMMADLCELLPGFSPIQRASFQDALNQLEHHLREAASEDELLRHLHRDITALSAAFLSDDGRLDKTFVEDLSFSLPPLPDDLAESDADSDIDSIRNIFITDIKRCFPPEEGRDQ
jgi:hypothetical protein